MKRFLIIFLTAVLFLPTFGNMVVYTIFKINQNEIAKTICIQRTKQFNTCNGRCELQKSLKKFDDNEKRFDNILKEKSELVYTTQTLEYHFTPAIMAEVRNMIFSPNCEKPKSVSFTVFHPPLV